MKMTVSRRPARSNRVPLNEIQPGTVVEAGDNTYLVTDRAVPSDMIGIVRIPGGHFIPAAPELLVRVCPARMTVEV